MKDLLINIERDTVFIAADLETTGLDPEAGHRICEMAFVKYIGNVESEAFEFLVNPLCPISSEATNVHGITDEMVAKAPAFADLFPKLKEFIGTDPIVFHNADFDLSFLRSETEDQGEIWPNQSILDTMEIAIATKRFVDHSLEGLCRELGIEHDAHRAGNDARATGQLLLELAVF